MEKIMYRQLFDQYAYSDQESASEKESESLVHFYANQPDEYFSSIGHSDSHELNSNCNSDLNSSNEVDYGTKTKTAFEYDLQDQINMERLFQSNKILKDKRDNNNHIVVSSAIIKGRTKDVASVKQEENLLKLQGEDRDLDSDQDLDDHSEYCISELLNLLRNQKLNNELIASELSTLETEERETCVQEIIHNPLCYTTHIKKIVYNCSLLRRNSLEFVKFWVSKPDFFYLPRKLLNDDMIPYPNEDSIEYEYLELGSSRDRNELREVIQEAEAEEEESSLPNSSKAFF